MRTARLLTSAALLAALAAPAAQAQRPRRAPAAKPAAAAPAPAAEAAPATAAEATPAPTAAAAPAGPRPMSESVAVTINNEVITTYDVRQRIRLLIVSTGVQPTEQNLPAIEREALRALVDERLQTQELQRLESRRKGSSIFPKEKEVDDEIEDMATSYGVKGPELIKTLTAAGIESQTLRNQLRTQIAWRRYIQGAFRDNVRLGDDQITSMMARINASASKPQYLVSEVFLESARTGGQEQALEGAQQLVGQLKAGAPFTAVARQFSALPTAANGGDAGWLTSGELQPELERAVETLKPGQISEPIPVRDGVYIVQLREKRAGSGAIMVSLKQAAVRLPKDAAAADVAAAQAKLEGLRGQVKGCDQLAPEAAKVQGVAAGDLGETSLEELSPDFRKAVDGLKPGEISTPVRTGSGLHLVALCGRRIGGAKEPTRAEVENKIFGEQLGMIARRLLRDLRNSAAIENR